MKPLTLVTGKLYFGVDARKMRESSARVLARVDGLPSGRAVVRLDALVEDFRVGIAASRAMVDEMLRRGLLVPQDGRGGEYGVTEKFRLYAQAEIVPPLPRSGAKMLLAHLGEVAWRFNRTAQDNKYEIDMLAVYGSYMSLEPELAEVTVAIVVRRRPPVAHPAAGRATLPLQGHEHIRTLIEGQSPYLRAHFHQQQDEVPRPFSGVFKSNG